jgi:hypothetical protein
MTISYAKSTTIHFDIIDSCSVHKYSYLVISHLKYISKISLIPSISTLMLKTRPECHIGHLSHIGPVCSPINMNLIHLCGTNLHDFYKLDSALCRGPFIYEFEFFSSVVLENISKIFHV